MSYWIKAYTEILDDPKMGTLPDSVWRICMELFLYAGELHSEGVLPPAEDIAWRLRKPLKQVREALAALLAVNILGTWGENGYIVTNFLKRQEPDSGAERAKRYRERNANVTQQSRNVTPKLPETETDTDRDVDTEKKRVDTQSTRDLQHTMERITGLPATPNDIQTLDELESMGATEPDIQEGYNWLKSQGKIVRYWRQLVGPTKTALAARVNPKGGAPPHKETAHEQLKRLGLA